jgi:fucose 4-O-acetylase-like acetyltransferase
MENAFTEKTKRLFSRAFDLPSLKKSRWEWVDYLKGLAIVLVAYRHVLIGIQRSGLVVPEWLVTANMIFFSFRMPLFFILSGLFISGSLSKRTVPQLINIKFANILYPYLVWSFIQISLQIFMGGSTNSNRGFRDYLYILYQPRGLDQFWYLPALFFATVFYILIKRTFNPPHWVQLLLGLLLYFLAPYADSVSIMSDWMSFYFFFALGDALSVFFFKASSQRFLKSHWTLIGMIPIFILTQVYYIRHNVGLVEFLIISLVGCLFMFMLAFRLERWGTLRFLRVLGYHSLYIYVMHVIVAAFIRVTLMKFFHIQQPVVLLVLGIFFGVTIPVIFYNFVGKDGIGWFLFSPTKKSKPAPGKLPPAAHTAG